MAQFISNLVIEQPLKICLWSITGVCTPCQPSQYVLSFEFIQKKDRTNKAMTHFKSRFVVVVLNSCLANLKSLIEILAHFSWFAFLCSADDEGGVRVISGCLEETVLLPCACTHNLAMEFKWQMDEPRAILLLKYDKNISSLGDSYKGRAKMFLPEQSNNCSVLLANITADDQGKYRCRFYDQERHIKKFVYLNISGESLCI